MNSSSELGSGIVRCYLIGADGADITNLLPRAMSLGYAEWRKTKDPHYPILLIKAGFALDEAAFAAECGRVINALRTFATDARFEFSYWLDGSDGPTWEMASMPTRPVEAIR